MGRINKPGFSLTVQNMDQMGINQLGENLNKRGLNLTYLGHNKTYFPYKVNLKE